MTAIYNIQHSGCALQWKCTARNLGLWPQAATPLSAVFQFFLRDLSGMLGGVTFAFLQVSDKLSQAFDMCLLIKLA